MSRVNESMGGQGAEAAGTGQSLRDSAARAGQQLRDVGDQLREAAHEQYDKLRRHASEYYEEGRRQLDHGTDQLEQYIQERPIKSVLIAAGIGVLLGILWKRS